jgi:hypothetical protein
MKLGYHILYCAIAAIMDENWGSHENQKLIKKNTSDPLAVPYY